MDYDLQARLDAAEELKLKAQGGSGQQITITTPFVGQFDPATDTTTTGDPTVRTGSGIVIEYTTFIRSGLRNEAGSLVQAGDKQMLLSALALDGSILTPPPAVNDKVTLENGDSFTITSLAPLSPAGVAIYFDCNIRGAK